MLTVDAVVLENPAVHVAHDHSAGGSTYQRLTFDARLLAPGGVCWLVLYGLRVARGRLRPPTRRQNGGWLELCAWNPEFAAAVQLAWTAAGWPDRYPGVEWPT